jgi:hypothetical protein
MRLRIALAALLAAPNPLPRMPAAGDNGAMQTAPPRADLPKRRRRWSQFSLRTLMIVVTLLAVPCAYVCHEAKIVAKRKALLAMELGPDVTPPGWWRSSESPPSLPLVRRWLGDQPICSMILPASLAPSLIEELRGGISGGDDYREASPAFTAAESAHGRRAFLACVVLHTTFSHYPPLKSLAPADRGRG